MRLLVVLGLIAVTSVSATAAEPLVSDFAFVMPEQWFLLPRSLEKDMSLRFRRFSVAMHKEDFDGVRSGRKDQVQLIGQAGTFYNSIIYTCQSDRKKSDFLTFHFPADISPASFKYDESKPKLNISILADGTSTHFIAEYIKGDIFVDASIVGVGAFLDFVNASALTLDFGEKSDRLNLLVADRFGTMDLSNATREILPIVLSVKPDALRTFSNRGMVERCLQYKKFGKL